MLIGVLYRPGVIAGDVDAALYGAVERHDVRAHILDAQLVVNIGRNGGMLRVAAEGHAVLGDDYLLRMILVVEDVEDIVEALRIDLHADKFVPVAAALGILTELEIGLLGLILRIARSIVVVSDEVHRLVRVRDLLFKVGRHIGGVGVDDDLGIFSEQHGAEPLSGIEVKAAVGGIEVLLVGQVIGIEGEQVDDGADLAVKTHLAVDLHRAHMCQIHDMAGGERLGQILVKRREGALAVAVDSVIAREYTEVRLVDGAPVFYAVAEQLKAGARVFAEPLDELIVGRSALSHHPLRQIPVEQIHERHDAFLGEIVEHIVVIIDRSLVQLVRAVREKARPCK